MIIRKINIDTIDKVKRLVGEATSAPFEVNIETERFTVNGKSILGIFSLNRTEPVTLNIHAEDGSQEANAFLQNIKDLLI